jgi:hypothetical protein
MNESSLVGAPFDETPFSIVGRIGRVGWDQQRHA